MVVVTKSLPVMLAAATWSSFTALSIDLDRLASEIDFAFVAMVNSR